MAIFKYTIANKDGKKLSGSVEAPDENTARVELQNLGFSILLLQETKEAPKTNSNLSKFIFEAIDKNTKHVSGTIPAKNQDEAIKKLESEYQLNVSAIWKDGASQAEIDTARKEGQTRLQNKLETKSATSTTQIPEKENLPTNPEQEKKIQFVKTKIELILKAVNTLLQKFDQDLAPDQKVEINKKIDKLLRIKNSTNLDYIIGSANELLKFLEEQEKSLKENVLKEKRFEYQVATQKMLQTLNLQEHKKTFDEDVVEKISDWQKTHILEKTEVSVWSRILNKILQQIKMWFSTPPEILEVQQQISAYNGQLWEFLKLYFKEPTPEYKEKVKNSIKAIWQARKRAKENLKEVKKRLQELRDKNKIQEEVFFSFLQEINALTGWLLAFYVIYYLTSLYITTKNFGLTNIPSQFQIYETHLFKYILVITFLFHSASAIKINLLRNSSIANIIIPPIFVFGSIITLLNF
ncbi:hypothetical protein HZA40_04225 [Candidatus Peregrinibacteria bacterium]|nr:hypothetical protein [Candidatus Peregrinibacteria bacterium]